MSRDDRIALTVMGIAALVLVALLAFGSSIPARAQRVVVTPPTSTTTLAPPAPASSLVCFDAAGYRIRTDRASAQRAHLTCPTKGTRP